jgi:hypothetical protein
MFPLLREVRLKLKAEVRKMREIERSTHKIKKEQMNCTNCIYAMCITKGGFYAYIGHCRRNPPVIIGQESVQPEVNENMHCGEYDYFLND